MGVGHSIYRAVRRLFSMFPRGWPGTGLPCLTRVELMRRVAARSSASTASGHAVTHALQRAILVDVEATPLKAAPAAPDGTSAPTLRGCRSCRPSPPGCYIRPTLPSPEREWLTESPTGDSNPMELFQTQRLRGFAQRVFEGVFLSTLHIRMQ